MRAVFFLLLLLLYVCACSDAALLLNKNDNDGAAMALPAPSRMLVDLIDAQKPPLMLVTSTQTPSFSFLAGDSGAVAMTHFQIDVLDSTAKSVVWSSSKQQSSNAVNVLCGKPLKPGFGYTWRAWSVW